MPLEERILGLEAYRYSQIWRQITRKSNGKERKILFRFLF